MPEMKPSKRPAARATGAAKGAKAATTSKSSSVWSDVEKAAMKEGARERKKAARLTPEEERAAGEQEIQAKIAEMPEPDHSMARRLHALVTSVAPSLMPRTFYGMPAYAKDGKVICFFQPKTKFKVRYATFGFQPDARIDDGTMWPASFAILELTPAHEERLAALVKKAAG
ncbi:MAG TPA: hypothetical protein VFW92_01490 [Candidatus Limnocylindrales bacterium]|jgi:hypothetical protein|nr:hypothetical protein [Candidatus Limnocylindrales bacterium]